MRFTKTILLVVFLILILVAILLIQIFRGPASKKPQQGDVIHSINNTSQSNNNSSITEGLKITSTNITSEPIGPTSFIKIKFTKAVNPQTLSFKVEPALEASPVPKFDTTYTELTIEPANAWNFNTSYQLIISKQTSAQDGQALEKDYSYSFKTVAYSGI